MSKMAAPCNFLSRSFSFFHCFRPMLFKLNRLDGITSCRFRQLFIHRKLITTSSQEIVCRCRRSSTYKSTMHLGVRHFTLTQPDNKISDTNCWKCKRRTDPIKEMFFCECGVVQVVNEDLNFFELFTLDEEFDLDTEHLSKQLKKLQSRLHPDRYGTKSKEEQVLSERQSSLINKAYTTLQTALSRGLYMLELNGHPIEENSQHSDPEFLAEIMETNEKLMETDSPETVKSVEAENQAKLEECIKTVSKAFKEHDMIQARKAVIKLQFYMNISNKVKALYRNAMG